MRIGIDGRFLLEKNLTGVGECAIGMVKGMAEFFPGAKLVIFLNSFQSIQKEKLIFLQGLPNVEIRHFRFPNKLLNLAFWLFSWPKIDWLLGGVDVFFLPNINFAPLSSACQSILMVHDLSFERWPETFSWKRRLWHFLINPKRLCQKTRTIWAVSSSTKEDLQVLYGIEKEKIRLIHSPFDWDFFAQAEASLEEDAVLRKKYSLPEKFILSLSTIEPRKNLVSLIRAFEYFQAQATSQEEKEMKLVIAGGQGWLWKETFLAVENSPVKDKIFLIGFVEKEEKPQLYRLAKVFVYPSLFEGFGYPPLEAMASGTPVIVSNNSSLNEVVGEAGMLIDPFRPFEIHLALKELFSCPELKEIYSQKGRIQAKAVFELGKKQLQEALEKIRKEFESKK